MRKNNTKFIIGLLAPAISIVGLVIIYPIIQAIYVSLTNYSLASTSVEWIGFKNFIDVLSNKTFWEVILNTVIISGSAVFFQAFFGLIMALLLDQEIKGKNFFRGLILINWVIPLIVVALLWMWIFDPEYGIFNFLLNKIGLLETYKVWLGRPILAKISIIITETWRGIPFMMVMFLAGLQTIPKSIVESAQIDGAGPLAKFYYITLPYVKQIGMIASMLSLIRLFQEFDIIYIMTGGGPLYSTTTMSIHIYNTAFNSLNMSKASSMGVIWLIFISCFALVYSKILTQQEF